LTLARKPLPLGGYGNIRLYGRANGRWTPKSKIPAGTRLGQWRAITNYRGHDGITRPVERSGTSIGDATDRLREHLTNLNGARGVATVMAAGSGEASDATTITSADSYLRTLLPQLPLDRPLTKNSRVIEGVPAYLSRIKEECAATSVDRYVSVLRTHVVPGVGQLLFVECTVPQLQQFDSALLSHQRAKKGSKPRKLSPHARRSVREVLRGLMQVAVEAEILQHNPVTSMRKIRGGSQTPAKAIPVETLPAFFAAVDSDERAARNDLPDIIRALFGLGTRIGETLALTWRYVNLTDKPVRRTVFKGTPNEQTRVIPPHYVWVNATISEPRGLPRRRSPVKTRRSNRVIPLPDFLYLTLSLRKPADAHVDEPVFLNPGPILWRSPHLVGEQLRTMRKRIDMPDFKSHAGRKTASTVLYDSGFRDSDLSDQFGHASGDFTRINYVEPAPAKREAAIVLDQAFSGGLAQT
jgi:integrase